MVEVCKDIAYCRNEGRPARRNPNAIAAEIVRALAARRVKVTPAHVYNVKATSGKARRGRRGDRYGAMIQAKKLADALGGVEKAREAVDALARLL